MMLKVVNHRLGQAEIRNAIAQHAADLVLAFKDGHLIPLARQQHRNGQTRRTRTNDGCTHAVALRGTLVHLLRVRGGNVVLNIGKMHRRTLSSQYAVSLALLFMVAHQRTHRSQGIIFKEHTTGIIQLASKHQLNGMRDRRMNRAASLTHGILTVQTAAGFLQNMHRHLSRPFGILFTYLLHIIRYLSQRIKRNFSSLSLCPIDRPKTN